jgi:hypothetical protein
MMNPPKELGMEKSWFNKKELVRSSDSYTKGIMKNYG